MTNNIAERVLLVDDNEFERFGSLVKDKCKVVILSSSDNKRDIDKIIDNNYVIQFVTKPLTEKALNGLKLLSVKAS